MFPCDDMFPHDEDADESSHWTDPAEVPNVMDDFEFDGPGFDTTERF